MKFKVQKSILDSQINREDSHPDAGAKKVKGKDSSNTCDSGGTPTKQNMSEFDAKEVKGAHRKQINLQIGNTALPAPKGKSSKHED